MKSRGQCDSTSCKETKDPYVTSDKRTRPNGRWNDIRVEQGDHGRPGRVQLQIMESWGTAAADENIQ